MSDTTRKSQENGQRRRQTAHVGNRNDSGCVLGQPREILDPPDKRLHLSSRGGGRASGLGALAATYSALALETALRTILTQSRSPLANPAGCEHSDSGSEREVKCRASNYAARRFYFFFHLLSLGDFSLLLSSSFCVGSAL